MIVIGLVAIGGAIVLAVLALDNSSAKQRRAMLDLVTAHGATGVLGGGAEGTAAAPAPATASWSQALLTLAERIAARGGLGARISAKLDRAGSALRVEEWLLITGGITAGAAVLLTLLLGVVGLFLGLVGGLVGPQLYLSFAAGRRNKRFGADLPDALQLVASGLASGYSLPQALDAVVSLGDGPISVEVGRALAQARLGTSVEDALEAAAERVGSTDLAWVVMAVRIQREVGGNLGEILLSVAGTIRERAWLRRHVSALAAEGKLSGYILGGLPVGIGAYMAVAQPEFISILFTQPLGLVLLAVAVLLLVLGGFWMRGIVKVDL